MPVDDLEGYVWLFRGVPAESVEVKDVEATGEVRAPYPSRIGEEFIRRHTMLNDTETGYTSWTTDRSYAEEVALETSAELSGGIVIFRVRIADMPEQRIFAGRVDED